MVSRHASGCTACRRTCSARAHRRAEPALGFSLVEVLVTMVLLSIGLVGLAALHARTTAAQIEAYQRIQALVIAHDMADRIAANKAYAPAFVSDDYGTGPDAACGALSGGALHACMWSNALRGTAEKLGGANAGTLARGHGCVTRTAPNQYLVVVAWQGVVAGASPILRCGEGDYGDDALRRAVAVPVHVADLAGA